VRNEPQHDNDDYICWGSQVHPNLQLSPISRMPRRVPEVLAGIARRGAAGMPHVAGGTGSPFRFIPFGCNPRQN